MNKREVKYGIQEALDNIRHLKNGLALCCTLIADKDQRDELLRAEQSLLEAMKWLEVNYDE